MIYMYALWGMFFVVMGEHAAKSSLWVQVFIFVGATLYCLRRMYEIVSRARKSAGCR
jgi:hypothetical protein